MVESLDHPTLPSPKGGGCCAMGRRLSGTAEQRQAVTLGDLLVSIGFDGALLILEPRRVVAEGGKVKCQVLGMLGPLELDVVDVSPVRQVRRQVVLGSDARRRRNQVEIVNKGGVARLGLKIGGLKVPREGQVAEEIGKRE